MKTVTRGMHKITQVKVKPNYTLALVFDDGTAGEIALGDRVFGPMFEPLKDPSLFAQVTIDPFGALCWPNDADLAPDALHHAVRKQITN